MSHRPILLDVPARSLLAGFVLVCVSWGQPLRGETSRDRNIVRAEGILDSGEEAVGGFLVEAQLAIADGQAESSAEVLARVEVWVTLPRRLSPEGPWAVTLVATAVDQEAFVHHELVEKSLQPEARGWVYRAEVLLPAEFQDAAVVVEEMSSRLWGGSAAALGQFVEAGEPKEPAEPTQLAAVPVAAPSEGKDRSTYEVLADRRLERPRPTGRGPETPSRQVIQLVPPTGEPLVGKVRFRTVVTTGEIVRAVFFVDNREVEADERPPFSATLDLGPEALPHRVRVEAFTFAGNKLGEDEVEVNLDTRPFRVAIHEIILGEAGGSRVVVDVSFPPWEKLDRLEFFRNDERVELLMPESSGRFEARMPGDAGPADFVRVVAHLKSGETREDARLFSEAGAGERVEVNLVEVYAVVTDTDGNPVQDLSRDSFRLKRARREVAIERFALADEVPLVLGLIIDSSESMFVQMVETKQAAAQFLGSTLTAQDRAFLVDFDTQPRLAQALSADVVQLLRSLSKLRAGGATALYDAAVFSLAQFEREPGRRALVLLTDGRDYGSRFGAKRGIQDARRLGVPLYVIAMSADVGVPGLTPGRMARPPAVDLALEAFAEDTGGRIFYIERMEELGSAYAKINAELRSQYLLAFSSEKPLSEAELRSIKVELDTKALSVRTVVLNR